MGLQTEIEQLIEETADKWDEYVINDKAPDGMITQTELANLILAKMREVVEGRIQDILLQLYNDGFVQGEIGVGDDQKSVEEATQAILKAMKD